MGSESECVTCTSFDLTRICYVVSHVPDVDYNLSMLTITNLHKVEVSVQKIRWLLRHSCPVYHVGGDYSRNPSIQVLDEQLDWNLKDQLKILTVRLEGSTSFCVSSQLKWMMHCREMTNTVVSISMNHSCTYSVRMCSETHHYDTHYFFKHKITQKCCSCRWNWTYLAQPII